MQCTYSCECGNSAPDSKRLGQHSHHEEINDAPFLFLQNWIANTNIDTDFAKHTGRFSVRSGMNLLAPDWAINFIWWIWEENKLTVTLNIPRQHFRSRLLNTFAGDCWPDLNRVYYYSTLSLFKSGTFFTFWFVIIHSLYWNINELLFQVNKAFSTH